MNTTKVVNSGHTSQQNQRNVQSRFSTGPSNPSSTQQNFGTIIPSSMIKPMDTIKPDIPKKVNLNSTFAQPI